MNELYLLVNWPITQSAQGTSKYNSFIHSLTHSFIHSLTHSLTHSLSHSLIHSLTCFTNTEPCMFIQCVSAPHLSCTSSLLFWDFNLFVMTFVCIQICA